MVHPGKSLALNSAKCIKSFSIGQMDLFGTEAAVFGKEGTTSSVIILILSSNPCVASI
jgi:hypothetical protein